MQTNEEGQCKTVGKLEHEGFPAFYELKNTVHGQLYNCCGLLLGPMFVRNLECL